ncbi:ammonium transporter (plasmid) [Hafnia alvei]|uniref:ammonium transporter n=1 Tax=Hafnia alvei TaxID=569 RepID=UPI00164331C1|nr:ammonium transporter [Hafnia alvei]MBI0278622.1 ammonium transporter [Hafnia alvei]
MLVATVLSSIDTANTGFMLVCTSLVMLMTPGLALFYGGLVSEKSVLTIMLQSFASMGLTTVIWFAFGYSMCFGPTIGGVIGDPTYYAFFNHINPDTLFKANNAGIPLIVHVGYQMMFAIITPALITGAFANRVTFRAYIIFLMFWLTVVYFPFVHMVWSPNGLLAHWGVLDFAGGIVVHNTAGFASLAAAIYVGKRVTQNSEPHSIPLVAIGTGLLWFGWYGFNAGSELRIDTVTVSAFLNTDVSASFAAVTWLIVELLHTRKPKFIGLLTGSVAGLATITPAAGYVSLQAAACIGIIASVVCYYTVLLVRRLLDDALDVFGVHGMGGLVGSILLGLFSNQVWNHSGANGLFLGDVSFFFKQVTAVIFSSIWSFFATWGLLWIIDQCTPVKISSENQVIGIDTETLGENAYVKN